MKKLLMSLIAFIVVAGGLFLAGKYAMAQYWEKNYGGPTYYTEITGDATNTGIEDGTTYFEYEQVSYDEDGNQVTVHLKEYRTSPLRVGAYLKMVVNEEKGVTSWEEVTADELPANVAGELN